MFIYVNVNASYTIQDIQYIHTFVQTMILRNNGLKLEYSNAIDIQNSERS